MKRDGTQATYELLETREDGTEVRLYPDGAKRNQNGQLIEAAPWNNIITSETARAYNAMRKQKILDAIEQKLVDITHTSAPAEAIAHIVGKRANVALTDTGRAGNDAAKIVLSAVDAYQPKQDDSRTNVLRHEYHIDDDTLRALERIAQARRGETIDVEPTDIRNEDE